MNVKYCHLNLIRRAGLILTLCAALLTFIPVRAFAPLAGFSSLEFVPNIETAGIIVRGTSLPKSAELYYRAEFESTWRIGHSLMRIDDGRLIGSLFGLLPSTRYQVKARSGMMEISGWVQTQADEILFAPLYTLHVQAGAASGGDGSAASPFKTIQEAVNVAQAGTQILVAEGIYRESVVFQNSGTENAWIQLKALDGAVLDGAQYLKGNIWTLMPGKTNVWQTQVTSSAAYLARNGQRFYLFDNLSALLNGIGRGNVPMSEGWYLDANTFTLYVRSSTNPANFTWQFPLLNNAITSNGQDWIWIEGFEIGFYGSGYGCGICINNSSHVMIRNNRIHNVQKGIFIQWAGGEDRGNDTRIEYNEIYDPPVDSWPWKAVKSTSMEGTAIILRGHIGAIVRENYIHNYFNGIYTGSSGDMENAALAFDADIYNNNIYRVSDDALEPEGACVNHRFRNNRIDRALVGVSLAPVTQGPTWVIRNVISNFTGRSLKFDRNSDGYVRVYHNTSWTNVAANGADVIKPIRNTMLRNNIFRIKSFAIREVVTGSAGNDWNYDNWNTAYTPRFKWENVPYNTIAKLCSGARLECKGYLHNPGLVNPSGGNFALLSSSLNIDRGARIYGINDDFSGNAPDIGAIEFTSAPPVDVPPVVSSVLRANSNPTSQAAVDFKVTFSEFVSGVDVNDFSLSATVNGASVTSVTPVSTLVYMVNVSTGLGDGTIRLDVLDDGSILDAAGNPLGGAGTGNGNFTTGETYTVSKSTASTVTSAFYSIGSQDGWILESGEFSNKGGTLDKPSTVIHLGDDGSDKQYKGILSFVTEPIPDSAVIVSAKLWVKKQGIVGVSPFNTHGGLFMQMIQGVFSGNVELVLDDFSAEASTGAGTQSFSSTDSAWYSVDLNSTNLAFINKTGATQFRLFFSKDDDDDLTADYLKIFSGNAAIVSDQPQLIILYSVP